MKKITLLSILSLLVASVIAQPEDKKISKITFLMVDGKYQDAAYKATKLIDDPEYRRNAWAYFYLSQSYYEIAKKPELQEEYPNALKESLKAAYKLAKYKDKTDENVEVYKDAQEFLSELKDSVITVSEIYYDNENPRKAAYYLKKIVKFDPDDYAIWLMKGVYEIKSRNIGEGVKSILMALDSIDQNYVPDEVSAQTMVDALEEYALIIKSGEYDKYFAAYKFEPTEADVQEALSMKEEFKKYVIGEVVNKEERKKESETIYKTFRSDEEDDEDDDE
jgi:tetratricopeptide (TPR) repeat protein